MVSLPSYILLVRDIFEVPQSIKKKKLLPLVLVGCHRLMFDFLLLKVTHMLIDYAHGKNKLSLSSVLVLEKVIQAVEGIIVTNMSTCL